MGFIDAHTHIVFKDTVTNGLFKLMSGELWRVPVEKLLVTPRDVVSMLDDANIDYVGVMAFPLRKIVGDVTEEYTIKVINAVRDYADRFAIIGGVEVNELSIDEVKYWLNKQYESGISAIKIHPVHHWVKPNAYRPEEQNLKQLELIYQFAEDHRLPVYIHTGTSMAPKARNKYGDPIFIDDVSVDFPRLTIIMAHMGRPIWMSTAFQLVRIRPNIYADLSSIPPKKMLEYVPRLAEISDKAIYGSDYPGPGVYDIKANLQEFLKIPIPNDSIKKIVDDNPRKILKPLSRNR